MKQAPISILIATIISSQSMAESLLSANQFPNTFNDLDFSTRQEFKAEDYAMFADMDAYDQLNIVYMDMDAADEIVADENQISTTPATISSTQSTFAPQKNESPQHTQSGGYCAITNPAIKSGQTIPIGKPVLESDYTYCSPYGQRNFGTKEKPKYDNHYGFDIGCTESHYDKPVFTTADGIVELVKHNQRGSSAGNYIRINHGNGFTTYYMHLNKILVTQGQRVSAGCQIGTIGNTGGAKAFKETLQNDYPTMRRGISHLHYEMHYNGNQTSISGITIKHRFSNNKSIDPAYFMGIKK